MSRSPVDLRQYLRRPDRAFWLELLKAPPRPTESDAIRRARLVRTILGIATVVAGAYAIASLVSGGLAALPVFLVNAGACALLGIGMWMAALGNHRTARLILVLTVNAYIAALLWLTGNVLGIGVYAVVCGAASAAVFSEEERPWRITFLLVPVILLVLSITVLTEPRHDLSSMPPGLLAFTRVLNAVLAAYGVFLLIALHYREVLRSENELVQAREVSDRLLHSVLPQRIADELRAGERMIANRHPEVTVLFADIAGFTPWAAQQDPEVVVSLLEKIFSRFDARVAAAGAEKIKTIGDAYMVISGAPDPRADHAHVIADLALALRDEVDAIRTETGIPLSLRIGIHSGPVIAGVIGALRFSYDVWGDTVNTASRMESHGEPGRIQLSGDTRALLGSDYLFEARGTIYIKGKGEMETWWLLATARPDLTTN